MNKIRITEAESQVMEALWRESPLTAEDIAGQVATGRGWTESTVKSLLNRLLNKDAVSVEREGRRYRYRPNLTRDDYLGTESQGLLDRLFDGNLAPLVSHLAQHRRLTEDDVAELRRIIDGIDDGR
jgi:BlaI family transcriptional regulator, penicillinase repressor